MNSLDEEQFVMETRLLKFLIEDQEPYREDWVNEYLENKKNEENSCISTELLKQSEPFSITSEF